MTDPTLLEGGVLRSRRALLLGGLATVAGLVGDAMLRARPALADDGDPVLAGQTTTSTGETRVETSGAEVSALFGNASGSGSAGIAGQVTSGSGLPTGVWANASATTGETIGVLARCVSDQGTAIRAREVAADGATLGVDSVVSSVDGIAVRAEGAGGDGLALDAIGRVRFTTSGTASIAKGARQVLVNPHVPITSATKVLCTLQSNPGGTTTVQRVKKNTTSDVFTIVLTAKTTVPTKVGWFVLE
jgi:hypothetical protein